MAGMPPAPAPAPAPGDASSGGLLSTTVASSSGGPDSPPIEFKVDWEPIAPAGGQAVGAAVVEEEDEEPTAVQKFLFPDKEELPDDFEVRCGGL